MMSAPNAPVADAPLVIIANDQEWTARAIASILEPLGYRVQRTFTARETFEVIVANDPDLVILDLQLPDYSGIDLCRQIRTELPTGAALPVIITTAGPSGRTQRLQAYEAGAWEFLGQPLDADALVQKVAAYRAAYRDVRRLRDEAIVDSRTGLYHRAGLARRATELLSEARRSGRSVSGVAWSISGGSRESIEQARRALRQQARAGDVVGELGRGEFAAVAAGLDSPAAERFAERMREVLVRTLQASGGSVRSAVVTGAETDSGQGDQLLDRLSIAMV